MSEILIHIGTFKTGSTALQQFFAHKKLPGVNYLRTGRLVGNGRSRVHHSDLFPALTKKMNDEGWASRVEALAKEAEVEISGAPLDTKFVLSSEYFSHAGFVARSGATALRKMFRQFPVKIVLYVRNRIDHFESYFYQECKRGNFLGTPEEFVAPYKQGPGPDFTGLVDAFAGVFGKENVVVVNYDAVRKDVVAPLATLLGVTGVNLEVLRSNDTPSVLSTLVIQDVARTLRKDGGNWRPILDKVVLQARIITDERPVTVLSNALREQIESLYRHDIARLQNEFGASFGPPSCEKREYQAQFDISTAKSRIICDLVKQIAT